MGLDPVGTREVRKVESAALPIRAEGVVNPECEVAGANTGQGLLGDHIDRDAPDHRAAAVARPTGLVRPGDDEPVDGPADGRVGQGQPASDHGHERQGRQAGDQRAAQARG